MSEKSMQAALSESIPWISTKATHQQNKRRYVIEIVIKGHKLRDSYLVIKEEGNIGYCFIPITANVLTGLINDTLTLTFHDHGSIKTAFDFQNSTDLELLVSHFSRCSILENENHDEFVSENTMFLKTIAMENIPKAPLSLGCTILTPIHMNAQAKQVWEEQCLYQNTAFYLAPQDIRLSFLTWNVAGKKPKEEVLADIMRSFKVPTALSDIIVIAFQEIDMSVKSVVTGNSNISDKWTDIVTVAQQQFGDSQFELCANESCGSVYIALLVRKNMNPKPVVGNVQIIKLGAGGILANKSALYIPFKIGEAKFAAVGAHLAAHDGAYEERNEQCRLIVKTVGDDVDFLPFQGDLNYRISMPRDEVVELCAADKIATLLENDQLKNQQKRCPIMASFKEAEIKFKPTYKFDKNSDVYDTSPKKRTPSYTDRVLIRTHTPHMRIGCLDELEFETDVFLNLMEKAGGLIKTDIFLPPNNKREYNFPLPPTPICYRSLKCTFSDHRPVHAAYKAVVPVVNKARKDLLLEIIDAKFSEMEQISVPNVSISPEVITVTDDVKEFIVVLKNESCVWANWSLKSTPTGVHITPAAGRLFARATQELQVTMINATTPNQPIMIDVAGLSKPVILQINS